MKRSSEQFMTVSPACYTQRPSARDDVHILPRTFGMSPFDRQIDGYRHKASCHPWQSCRLVSRIRCKRPVIPYVVRLRTCSGKDNPLALTQEIKLLGCPKRIFWTLSPCSRELIPGRFILSNHMKIFKCCALPGKV